MRSLCARMQEQRVEIGGKEPGVRQQWPQDLQHQQFVVDVGTEDANGLDAIFIVTAQLRIQLLDAIPETP